MIYVLKKRHAFSNKLTEHRALAANTVHSAVQSVDNENSKINPLMQLNVAYKLQVAAVFYIIKSQ